MTADDGNGRIRKLWRLCKHSIVIQRIEIHQDGRNTQQETKVPYPVHQKCLEIGKDRGFLFIPEANQQIGHQTYCFPAEEQLQEIIGHDQHQHCKGKQ